MPIPFTFFFKKTVENIPPFEIEYFEDEISARGRALELLRERRQYDAVEVGTESDSFTVQRSL